MNNIRVLDLLDQDRFEVQLRHIVVCQIVNQRSSKCYVKIRQERNFDTVVQLQQVSRL